MAMLLCHHMQTLLHHHMQTQNSSGPVLDSSSTLGDSPHSGLVMTFHLCVNEFGQPNCEEAVEFANYRGTMAKNGMAAPLCYTDWRPSRSKTGHVESCLGSGFFCHSRRRTTFWF